MSCRCVNPSSRTMSRIAMVVIWLLIGALTVGGGAGTAAAQGLTDGATHPPPSTGSFPFSPPGGWLPGTAGFPQAGQSFVDPVFGTTIRRITNDFPGQSFSSI